MTRPAVALDTTAAIAWIRRESGIPDRLAQLAGVGLPVDALGELLFGVAVSAQPTRNLARVHDLVGLCDLLPVTEGIARRYATLRHALTEMGRTIPSNDLWIAATAVEHGIPLLCRDRHFFGIPGLGCEQF